MKQIVLILIGILFIKNLIAFDDYSTKSLSSSKHIIDSSTFYNGFETTTEELSQIYKTSTKNSNEEEFETQIYDEESDQYESDFCSIDSVIDYSIENLLPTDYEENKKLDPKRKIKHLNETIATFRRLEEYSKNVSEIMKPIMKRVMPRITDILLMINLPPDCMASLARIGQSAREGETWALKCRSYRVFIKISYINSFEILIFFLFEYFNQNINLCQMFPCL
jgi:ABC-type ATPase with predicted acetyltransferase domain